MTGDYIALEKELCISNKDLITLMQAVFSRGMPFKFQAKGFSMHPFIRNKDTLTISPFKGKARCGDILTVVNHNGNGLVVHRLIKQNTGLHYIKGDNSGPFGNYNKGILKNNIIGIVTGIERNRKKIRIGLGPERIIISYLNRFGLIRLLLVLYNKLR